MKSFYFPNQYEAELITVDTVKRKHELLTNAYLVCGMLGFGFATVLVSVQKSKSIIIQ